MTSGPQVRPDQCPLCLRPNRCALAGSDSDREKDGDDEKDGRPCWCFTAVIGPDVLDRIADESRGVACVCEGCAGGHRPPEPGRRPPSTA